MYLDHQANFEKLLERERHLGLLTLDRATKLGDKIALKHSPNAYLESISWKSFGDMIRQTAQALLQWGVQAQDKVGLFSQNRAEWSIADIAIQCIRHF